MFLAEDKFWSDKSGVFSFFLAKVCVNVTQFSNLKANNSFLIHSDCAREGHLRDVQICSTSFIYQTNFWSILLNLDSKCSNNAFVGQISFELIVFRTVLTSQSDNARFWVNKGIIRRQTWKRFNEKVRHILTFWFKPKKCK